MSKRDRLCKTERAQELSADDLVAAAIALFQREQLRTKLAETQRDEAIRLMNIAEQAARKMDGLRQEAVEERQKALRALSGAEWKLEDALRGVDRLQKKILQMQREKIGLGVADETVADLALSARSGNALRHEGIRTLAQLCGKTKKEMLRIPNLGRKSVEDIEVELAGRGLHLAGDT